MTIDIYDVDELVPIWLQDLNEVSTDNHKSLKKGGTKSNGKVFLSSNKIDRFDNKDFQIICLNSTKYLQVTPR